MTDPDEAHPCPTCRIGWVDDSGECDEPGCPGETR